MCFSASIGMFGWGNLTGWTNAANLQLRNNRTANNESVFYEIGFGMDDEGSSWVGSSMAFGAILGSMIAGKLFSNLT
jgi:hypothetical protein